MKEIIIMVLLFLVGLETGILIKQVMDWRYGPVPLITASELHNVLENGD